VKCPSKIAPSLQLGRDAVLIRVMQQHNNRNPILIPLFHSFLSEGIPRFYLTRALSSPLHAVHIPVRCIPSLRLPLPECASVRILYPAHNLNRSSNCLSIAPVKEGLHLINGCLIQTHHFHMICLSTHASHSSLSLSLLLVHIFLWCFIALSLTSSFIHFDFYLSLSLSLSLPRSFINANQLTPNFVPKMLFLLF
jgi:hypothetical protein